MCKCKNKCDCKPIQLTSGTKGEKGDTGSQGPQGIPGVYQAPTLQEVLVAGNETGGTNILVNNADAVELENGSLLKKGTYDFGGGGGISQICSVGYEDNWQSGIRHVFDNSGNIRESSNCFNIIPDNTFDGTLRFKVGSRWVLDNGDVYVCSDAATGTAIWVLANVTANVTLQQVLNNNHDLVDDNNFQGTSAGNGNTGIYVNAFGFNSANNNNGDTINAIGVNAAQNNVGSFVNSIGQGVVISNSGAYVNAIGNNTAQNNTGDNVNAMGSYSAFSNNGDNVNALGYESALNNTGNYVNGIGYNAASNNIGSNINAVGYYAASANEGSYVNAMGDGAAAGNTGNNVIAFGDGSSSSNTGNNVVSIGTGAGAGNPLSGMFIIANTELPSYANHAAASAAISPTGIVGNTYIYHNQATDSIGAVRL